ncbi:unnamed protein product [Discosporangium mesarthrocarpum]
MPACFSYSAQPDVVLSMDRDAYYAQTLLGDNVTELLEVVIGSRRASILAPELRMLAAGLYYGLTNFSGQQTLGQEYCDILLVGSSKRPGSRGGGGREDIPAPLLPSAMRFYTVLHVVIPYLQERWREGCHGFRSLRDPFARRAIEESPSLESQRSENRGSGQGPLAGENEGRPNAASNSRPNFCLGPGAGLTTRRFGEWVRRRRLAVAAVLDWIQRVHLMLFYFDGRYQNLAMRVLGARLMYNRAHDEPRAKYTILGLFLLVQVAAEAVVAARREVFSRGERETAPSEEAGGGRVPPGFRSHQVKARVPSTTVETAGDSVLFPPSGRRCSLCMAPREFSAATPCGHLFCWECIVGWCQTNPECPLCRQLVQPQAIVCLHQYS